MAVQQDDRVPSYRELTERATVVTAALGHRCEIGTPHSCLDGIGPRVPTYGPLLWYEMSFEFFEPIPSDMVSLSDGKPIAAGELGELPLVTSAYMWNRHSRSKVSCTSP